MGCSPQGARTPPVGPSGTEGPLPLRVLPGHSLCGPESHEVMPAPYQVPLCLSWDTKALVLQLLKGRGRIQHSPSTSAMAGGFLQQCLLSVVNQEKMRSAWCRKHTIAWPPGLADRQPGARLFQVPPTSPMKHRSDRREEAQLKKTVTPKGLERRKDTPSAFCQITPLSWKYALYWFGIFYVLEDQFGARGTIVRGSFLCPVFYSQSGQTWWKLGKQNWGPNALSVLPEF